MVRVMIRNRNIPKKPRVFDVLVNEKGQIIRYEIQNIRGLAYVDMEDVRAQINEAIKTE